MGAAKSIIAIALAIAGGVVGYCAMGANAVSDSFYSGANARWVERGGLVALVLLCTALILMFLRTGKPEEAVAAAPEDEAAPVEAPKPEE